VRILRLSLFRPYQLNLEIVQLTGMSILIIHCLTVHRDVEINSEVFDIPNNGVYDQFENR
jgi:ornithine carbamoyltransferase